MEIIKVIRVSEILAVLTIALYWLIFPNNFSEPLIIILGGIAVLFGEIVNFSIKKSDKEQNEVESNVYWTISKMAVECHVDGRSFRLRPNIFLV